MNKILAVCILFFSGIAASAASPPTVADAYKHSNSTDEATKMVVYSYVTGVYHGAMMATALELMNNGLSKELAGQLVLACDRYEHGVQLLNEVYTDERLRNAWVSTAFVGYFNKCAVRGISS